MLCDIALPLVELRLNSRVVSVSPDPLSPHAVLQSGEVVHADVIIGADGVKSVIRTCLVDGPDLPTPTGDAVFRTTISTEPFKDDPDLKPFFDHPEATVWMGPDKHVVAYNLVSQRIRAVVNYLTFFRVGTRYSIWP
jgi:salicylate hydroxylase